VAIRGAGSGDALRSASNGYGSAIHAAAGEDSLLRLSVPAGGVTVSYFGSVADMSLVIAAKAPGPHRQGGTFALWSIQYWLGGTLSQAR
jgi:hypothetical protein